MSQEQSGLMQAQNGNGMVWTSFSGFQQAKAKADDAECNLLNQEDDKEHLNNSMMFDPGSTMDHFKNPDLVQDIQQTKRVMELKTNAGSKLNNRVAWLPDCGEVWFDKDALANAMALKNVKKMFKVDHNSEVEDAFILTHQKTGKVIELKCQKNGLHAFAPPATHRNWNKNKNQVWDQATQEEVSNLAETFKGNMEGLTARQVKKAEMAQELRHDVGPIAEELFKTQVQTNTAHICPMTVDDINNARKTLGESMHALKGNHVRQ